tara:strand:+ start:152 stop:271 length:120 start_codon:yes stop_codon:yes gene_type:complete
VENCHFPCGKLVEKKFKNKIIIKNISLKRDLLLNKVILI